MSSVACGEPLSLAHLPLGQVIALHGLSDDQVAISLDPLPGEQQRRLSLAFEWLADHGGIGIWLTIRVDLMWSAERPTGARRHRNPAIHEETRRREPGVSVEPDELTGTKQAVLLVLMAEARPVRNPELATLGPELKKQDRDELVRRGLIEVTTENRTMVLELTDRGWATCAAIIGADIPERPSGQGKAFYTVLRALRRYFDREGLKPAEVFFPLDDNALAGEPDVLGDQIEEKVHAAYVRLAARSGGWVDLVRLREDLSEVSRHDLDAALTRMYRVPGVSLVPEENQKTLTAEDHAAAVLIGDQAKHLIAIEV